MEQLCDEERYLELRTDIQEKMVYEGMCVVHVCPSVCLSTLPGDAIFDGISACRFHTEMGDRSEVKTL